MYTNTQLCRTLNNATALPTLQLIQENQEIPVFSHHTEKTEYVNKLLRKGRYVPVSLVLHKMGFNLIDTKDDNTSEQFQSDWENIQARGLSPIIRRLKEANILYWYQLTKEDDTVFTYSELLQMLGTTVDNPGVVQPSWERLVKTVTNEQRVLNSQYIYNRKNDTNEHPTTHITPNFIANYQVIPNKKTPSHIVMWTDGSKTKTLNPTAHSSVFVAPDSPHNMTFRTTGNQSVFNAEAQAIEFALTIAPIQNVTIVTDSKSVEEAIKAMKTCINVNRPLLPQQHTPEQLWKFIQLATYKYSKKHKYAHILQSILLQILMRESKQYTVEICHVNSHLLDEQMGEPTNLSLDEQAYKMKHMHELYSHNTIKYLTGNYWADKQLSQPIIQSRYRQINLNSSTLPRFIIQNILTGEYSVGGIKEELKKQMQNLLLQEYLADYPELEMTRFSPEVDWESSIWPIKDTKTHMPSLENF
jgi:ribonuclease HI